MQELPAQLTPAPRGLRRPQAGFTLIETMIALIILVSALVLLATSWSSSLVRVTKALRSFEISSLLERNMVEIDLDYRGKSLDNIPDTRDGEFDGVEDVTWKMESKKLELPDLASLMPAQKEGGVDQMTMSLIKQLTDALTKSIKEVTVTVIYKKAKKPLEYSATTYFVDYDKDIPLGVPGG